MKRIIAWLTIFSFTSYIFPVGNLSAQPPQKTEAKKIFLAVLDLNVAEGVPSQAKVSLTDLLREQLWKTGKFRVVDRNNMERILKEQGFQLSDCTSQECAVQVGRLLGVEKMVTGNVSLLGSTYMISVQMTNVETGEIESMASDRCSDCELDQLFGSIDKISSNLAGKTAAPPEEQKPLPPPPLPKIKPAETPATVPAIVPPPAEEKPAAVSSTAKKRWYKKAWVWILIGGVVTGAAVAGALAKRANQNTGDIRIGL